MTNNYCLSLILILFLYSTITAEDCDNICYRDLKYGIRHLEEIYGKPPTVSNISSLFDYVSSLINKTENVNSRIRNLDGVANKTTSIQETITRNSNTTKLLKNIVNEIGAINKLLQEIRTKTDNHLKASNECEKASSLFDTLTKDTKELKKTGNEINEAFQAINDRIADTNNQSGTIKHDLDVITVGDNLFRKYLCQSTLHSTIKDVIELMKNISEYLKASFTEQFELKIKELENNVTWYEQNIEEMEKSLTERLPETDLKVTGKTELFLEDLRAQVDDLKKKIKNIKLDKTFEDILGEARLRLKQLINEYEQILNHIFSSETKNIVKEEISKATKVLNLVKQKNSIKAELDDIKKIVETLKANGVCFINEKVSVEDK